MWGEHSYKQGCPGPPGEGPGDASVRGAHTSAGDAGGTFWTEDTGTQGVVRLKKAGCPLVALWTEPSAACGHRPASVPHGEALTAGLRGAQGQE